MSWALGFALASLMHVTTAYFAERAGNYQRADADLRWAFKVSLVAAAVAVISIIVERTS